METRKEKSNVWNIAPVENGWLLTKTNKKGENLAAELFDRAYQARKAMNEYIENN